MPTTHHHPLPTCHMKNAQLLLFAIFLLAPASSPISANDQARAEFQAVCSSLRNGYEPYYGRASLEQFKSRLAAPSSRSRPEASLRQQLARELLEQGNPTEAIKVINDALNLLKGQGPSLEIRERLIATLALAHVQAAEDVNCLQHHTAASCLLPISRDGLHPKPEHAKRAAELYLQHLELQPDNVISAWLLNLMQMVSGDHPDGVPPRYRLPEDAFESGGPLEPWPERGVDLGINAVDLAGGAIMDDFDGDGLLDLISSTSDHCDHVKAFRNDGRGGFEDVSERWGLDSQLGGLNLVHADFDNDGRLDLLILRGAWLFGHGRIRNSLLRNEPGPNGVRFVDVTHRAGLASPALPTQTAGWADYDGDGDLDLYVGSETLPDDDFSSLLYRNNGDGTFSNVTRVAGVANMRYAKAVTWGDYDNDGDPDLYVSNIGANRLYRNNGDGSFDDVAAALGVTRPELRSFASWFFDFDNDADLDLFVADYQAQAATAVAAMFGLPAGSDHARLYRNDGARFTEVSKEMHLDLPTLPMGANYGDLDNDGWLDIYLGTGDPEFETLLPNKMYRNDGGRAFLDVTSVGRFGHLQKGHGVAFGDLDNDGDQDLFHQLGGFYPGDQYGNALFENPGSKNRWITLRLVGKRANRFAAGARIEIRVIENENQRSIYATAGSGGTFGGSSYQQEIGLGEATEIAEIVISWPGSGTVQRFTNVAPNRAYRAVEGSAELEVIELPLIEWPSRRPMVGRH
ncbi:MAG: CRTAC1 family protein [bacterium]|nr:CRTAC1 family protein [bacterium]